MVFPFRCTRLTWFCRQEGQEWGCGCRGPTSRVIHMGTDKRSWEAGWGQAFWGSEEGGSCPCPCKGLLALSKGSGTQLGSATAFLGTADSQSLGWGIRQPHHNLACGGALLLARFYGWGEEGPGAEGLAHVSRVGSGRPGLGSRALSPEAGFAMEMCCAHSPGGQAPQSLFCSFILPLTSTSVALGPSARPGTR